MCLLFHRSAILAAVPQYLQAPRRFFLEQRSAVQNTWTFRECWNYHIAKLHCSANAFNDITVYKREKSTKYLGSVSLFLFTHHFSLCSDMCYCVDCPDPFDFVTIFHPFQQHGSDISNFYGGGELTDYLINFIVSLDPNAPSTPSPSSNTTNKATTVWPKWSNAGRSILVVPNDTMAPLVVENDTFREHGMKLVTKLLRERPL